MQFAGCFDSQIRGAAVEMAGVLAGFMGGEMRVGRGFSVSVGMPDALFNGRYCSGGI